MRVETTTVYQRLIVKKLEPQYVTLPYSLQLQLRLPRHMTVVFERGHFYRVGMRGNKVMIDKAVRIINGYVKRYH